MLSDYYEITVPPINDPVALSDVKDWCKITHSYEDSVILGLIKTAVSRLEAYTNRAFSPRTVQGSFSFLACCAAEKGPVLELRRAPLISLDSLTADGDEVDTDYYTVRNTGGYPRIVFNQTPDYDSSAVYPFVATFAVGYHTIPESVKTAIKQYVCFMFSNRGDCVNSIPGDIKNLVSEYRILNCFG